MKATILTTGLLGLLLTASASGGCSSSSGGVAGSDGGSSEAGSGSSSGGNASASYCFYEQSGAQRCVGYGGLASSDCAALHGTIVPSCPSAGMVGCCSISPNYEECWYCPSDPSQLKSACETLRAGQWTAGMACGDAGSGEGGASEPIGCQPSASACTCIVSNSSTAPPPSPVGTCPGTQIPSAICCAGPGYPSQDLSECQCQPAVCSDTGNSCTCAIDGIGTATSCTNTYQYCCANVLTDGSINACTCTNFACGSGTMQVPSCSPSVLTCVGTQMTKVATCR